MYSIGIDPELFLVDSNNEFVSAHDVFKGTKELPFRTKFGAVQVDGVAIEFNTNPCSNVDKFLKEIDLALKYIKIEAKKHNLKPVVTPTAYFEKTYFDNLPYLVKKLGCEADYNIYSGEQNPPPGTTLPFRTGAGHIHIGWGEYIDLEDNYEDKVKNIVAQLDSYLYFKSFEWDNDENRRLLYGKIGSFRYKPYGLEYRPLSNKWLSNKTLQESVYKIVEQSLKLYDEGNHLFKDEQVLNMCNETFYNKTPQDKIKDYVSYIEDKYNLC